MVVEEKWIEGCGERESGDSGRGKHEDLTVEYFSLRFPIISGGQ